MYFLGVWYFTIRADKITLKRTLNLLFFGLDKPIYFFTMKNINREKGKLYIKKELSLYNH